MRFSIKIFICTVVTVAVSFSASGYLLISSNFSAAKDREIRLALNEHLSLQYILESAVITRQLQGQTVSDDMLRSAVQDIAVSLQQNRQDGRSLLMYDNDGEGIYPAAQKSTRGIGETLLPGQVVYAIKQDNSAYKLVVTGLFIYSSKYYYLKYTQDISQIFIQRETQVHSFIVYQGINILMSAVLTFLISWLLTRPVRKLTQTSRRISAGEYSQRVDIRSSDEIGELALSFNRMAESVEDKILQLEQASQAKDEFIANFTHELKTPMTSIIGYADMLRSRQLEPTTAFKAAQYIYSEANRLESLSLKMLDLVLLEQQHLVFVPVNCPELLQYIQQVTLHSFQQSKMQLIVTAQEGYILAEQDFIKTMLINIVDNARKASDTGSTVELCGIAESEQYILAVTDHGKGIPQAELSKITEAFYMVDKSRSRALNGAGLGLTIASKIAALHHTELQFQSTVGEGTSVSIKMPLCTIKEVENED